MRPFDAMIVYRRVVNTVLLYAKQKKLLDMVISQIEEKERRSNMMVDILSHIVEFRNGESGQHIVRIRTFAEIILRQLQRMTSRYSMTPEDVSLIVLASALHDIGKIAIDEKILNKPGKLTEEEFAVIKTHSLIGAQMLESLTDYQDVELVKISRDICRWHHERYDGRGYPDGLKGDEIPISAQVVALADVYDALVSERCYKKAFPHDKAIQMILNGECGVFNPLLLDCLKRVEGVLNTEFSCVQNHEKIFTRRGMMKEVMSSGKAFASEHTVNLMDQERLRYDMVSAMSDEIPFEYNAVKNVFKTMPIAAAKLGINEIVVDPLRDEKILSILGGRVSENIMTAIQNASPDNPMVSYEDTFIIDGRPHWYRFILRTRWEDEKFVGLYGKAIDINASRTQIDELELKAARDSATGLLNHASAREIITKRIEKKPNGNFALAIFDLDNFKSFNDTYGHTFGDKVLKYVAEMARDSVRENDIVARIGGDEFMLFFEYNADIEKGISRIFDSIVGSVEGVRVTVSMGVAESAVAGNEYYTLFHAADQALYCAKRGGRCRWVFYDESMKETLSGTSNKPNEEDKI